MLHYLYSSFFSLQVLTQSIGTLLPISLSMLTGIFTISFFFLIAQAELDENIELYSKTTKDDKDNSNQPILIKLEENYTLGKNISFYDGLGLYIEIFYPWTILDKSDKSTCSNIDLCFIKLGIINGTNMPQAWIIQDRFESQTIKEYCKCNTLEDYKKHFYTNMISQFDKFSLIKENQITLPDDRSSILLEYEFSPKNTQIHTYTIFTKNDDSFYQFTYYSDPESFSRYLSDFKKVIDIIKFAAQNEL